MLADIFKFGDVRMLFGMPLSLKFNFRVYGYRIRIGRVFSLDINLDDLKVDSTGSIASLN